MSEQKRPATRVVQVRDLCGEPVDTYGHRDWSALNIGHAPIGAGQKELGKKVFVFWRKRHGDRASGVGTSTASAW